MPTPTQSYAGFTGRYDGTPLYSNGQPWAMPAAAPPPTGAAPGVPAGTAGYQGLGNFGSDPFGYSGGSMLTPWTQPLPSLGPGGPGSGAVVAPDLKPWQYQDFNYSFTAPGGYAAGTITAPDKFTYMNFDAPGAFRAPTADDMRADPAYEAQLRTGRDAVEKSAAFSGTLRSGGTLRDLARFGDDLGAQAYDRIYNRRASEYDRAYGISRDTYATNRSNAAENYDRNFRNRFDVEQANEGNRLNAYTASSDVALRGGELGYNIATGTYDRNQANAKAAYDSQQEMARASAAAANATNERDYRRAMEQYGMAYDIFNRNQDTQFGRLLTMTQLGMGAAGAQAGYAGNYGGTLADLYTGGANARAAGYVGSGNAWSGAISGGVNDAIDIYGMSRMGVGGYGTPVPRPTYPSYGR